MAISYQSKDDAVLGLQLKVQEICARKSDTAVVSVSGLTAIIKLGERVKEVRAAIHCDDSEAAPEDRVKLVAQAQIAIGTPPDGVANSQVTLTLGAALADEDAIILKYVVDEQA